MAESKKNAIQKGDLTEGSIVSKLVLFALPLIAGNIVNQLYNVADSLVVGNFVGSDALAAVGVSFSVMMSFNALFFGLSHGNIAQFVLAGLLGLFMGYIDVRHNSLIPSILVHFGVNLMGVFTQLLPRLTGGTQTEIYGVITVALMAVAAVGGVFFVLFARRNIFPRATIHQQLRCRNVAATSATTVVALALYIIIMIKTTFY